MITDKGKNILAKYIIGQAPSYASFIALGVGPKPLAVSDPVEDYSAVTEPSFEVLRIPISSRGYVYDDQGRANVVFSGEIPTEQRYEFTEIGIFSGKSNPAAGSRGSRMLYTFSESENWEFHNQTQSPAVVFVSSPQTDPDAGQNNIIADTYLEDGQIVDRPAFLLSATNTLFTGTDTRKVNYQTPRFLDKALFVRGNMSKLNTGASGLELEPTTETDYYSSHIHLLGTTINLNENSADDELRLAFSIVDRYAQNTANISSVKIMIEFAASDSAEGAPEYARLEIDMSHNDYDFNANRYYVMSSSLGNLNKSTNFQWDSVRTTKIYASVYEDQINPTLSDNFFIALDGVRFENTTSTSPLYGMTGYSIVRNDSESTIVKESNSSNIVEFRFGLDVQ